MAKILVVDDDPAIVDLITETLDTHEILSANNGTDGIERARKERPNLVIMDVSMPKLNGMIACSRMKNDPELSRIPVIMLTAWGRIADIEEGFATKADDYLVKPFSPKQLRHRVDLLLAPAGNAKACPA